MRSQFDTVDRTDILGRSACLVNTMQASVGYSRERWTNAGSIEDNVKRPNEAVSRRYGDDILGYRAGTNCGHRLER